MDRLMLNGVATLRYVFALGIISIERAQQTLINRHDRFVKINTCSTSFYLHELPVDPMIGRGNSCNHLEEVTSEWLAPFSVPFGHHETMAKHHTGLDPRLRYKTALLKIYRDSCELIIINFWKGAKWRVMRMIILRWQCSFMHNTLLTFAKTIISLWKDKGNYI